MIIRKIDSLLNDAEINYLCDLYLSCIGFKRDEARYRYLRNAVIISSHGFLSFQDMITRLAECAGVTAVEYLKYLRDELDTLGTPVSENFNSAFSAYDEFGTRITPAMKPDGNLSYIITFLGSIFTYIIISYYPKYDPITFID